MKCPHCLEHFHSEWKYTNLSNDVDGMWGVGVTECAACRRSVIAFGKMTQETREDKYRWVMNASNRTLVRPKSYSRVPLSKEIPNEFSKDYSEACLVLTDSEKASAALSRRCLQHLLREKAGVSKGDLANEIQQVLDSKQLPPHLAEDLDAIRNIGNFAAHPLKNTHTGEIVDIEPEEAEWQLNILEQLFDFYFVQPSRAKAKRDALNAKLHSIGKPMMKAP